MPDRLFAIGDIHGCSTALMALIGAIDPRPEDTIVVLGDMIDWGPDSRGCVQQIIDLSSRCRLVPLLGNHEEMLLRALQSDSALRSWLDLGGEQTLLSYPYDGVNIIDPAHVAFIRGCRDYHEADRFIFAHAAVDPDLPMDQQPSLKLRWDFPDLPSQRPHYSGKTVIVGHTPQTSGEVLDLGHVLCLDTDCSRGGWLSGLEVGTGKIIQVDRQGRPKPGITCLKPRSNSY
jgi:serine/threonine protein phosphatase 1